MIYRCKVLTRLSNRPTPSRLIVVNTSHYHGSSIRPATRVLGGHGIYQALTRGRRPLELRAKMFYPSGVLAVVGACFLCLAM